LGELLTWILVLEHTQLLFEIEQAKSAIKSARLERLSRNKQLSEESVMYGLIKQVKAAEGRTF
jgi:hypothetical protein